MISDILRFECITGDKIHLINSGAAGRQQNSPAERRAATNKPVACLSGTVPGPVQVRGGKAVAEPTTTGLPQKPR